MRRGNHTRSQFGCLDTIANNRNDTNQSWPQVGSFCCLSKILEMGLFILDINQKRKRAHKMQILTALLFALLATLIPSDIPIRFEILGPSATLTNTEQMFDAMPAESPVAAQERPQDVYNVSSYTCRWTVHYWTVPKIADMRCTNGYTRFYIWSARYNRWMPVATSGV